MIRRCRPNRLGQTDCRPSATRELWSAIQRHECGFRGDHGGIRVNKEDKLLSAFFRNDLRRLLQ